MCLRYCEMCLRLHLNRLQCSESKNKNKQKNKIHVRVL